MCSCLGELEKKILGDKSYKAISQNERKRSNALMDEVDIRQEQIDNVSKVMKILGKKIKDIVEIKTV